MSASSKQQRGRGSGKRRKSDGSVEVTFFFFFSFFFVFCVLGVFGCAFCAWAACVCHACVRFLLGGFQNVGPEYRMCRRRSERVRITGKKWPRPKAESQRSVLHRAPRLPSAIAWGASSRG